MARAPAFTGDLLIADRGNNRLLLVDAAKRVLWTYPSASRPAPPGGFYFPDDAFFARVGTQIISNEEDNNAIVQIAFPSGRLLWSYGHPKVAGSAPGYPNHATGERRPVDLRDRRLLRQRVHPHRTLALERQAADRVSVGSPAARP